MTLSIVHVTPQLDVGGAETMVVELAEGMASRGHQVHVVARPGALQNQLSDKVSVVPVSHTGKFTTLLNFTWQIRRLVRERRVDVINAHSIVTALAARLAAPRIPLVCTVHGLRESTYKMAGAFLSFAVNMVSPVSMKTAASLGTPPRKTRVIWTGIRTLNQPPFTKADLEIPQDAVVLGSVARLSPEKGTDHLIRIFASLLQELPSAVLVVVGDGPDRERVWSMVKSLKIEDRVRMLGQRMDVHRILRVFDLVLLPSRREGVPRAVLEALFAGVPVVAANVGGLTEVAEVTDQIVLVDSYDTGPWWNAVSGLLGRGEKPLDETRLRDRFGVDKMVDHYMEMYQHLVSSKVENPR